MKKLSHPGAGIGGFTRLELLVVIVIIGLLAGYVAPRYFSRVGKCEVQVAKVQIESFEKALDLCGRDNLRFPSAKQGPKALVDGRESVAAARIR